MVLTLNGWAARAATGLWDSAAASRRHPDCAMTGATDPDENPDDGGHADDPCDEEDDDDYLSGDDEVQDDEFDDDEEPRDGDNDP